jgi:hypothetical protein
VPSGSLSFTAGAGLHTLAFQGRSRRQASLTPATTRSPSRPPTPPDNRRPRCCRSRSSGIAVPYARQ